jgi:cobalt-zinc-cadmium efflux system membrane fusion protein
MPGKPKIWRIFNYLARPVLLYSPAPGSWGGCPLVRKLLLWRPEWARAALGRTHAALIAVLMALVAGGVVLLTQERAPKRASVQDTELSSQSKRSQRFVPTEAQWASLGVEPVKSLVFRAEHATEGKISINEDRATPIYPPYAGRVTRLLARPGDAVKAGEPLFYIEAADMVQAQNDFLAAVAGLNRARSRVTITEIIEKQNRTLYQTKAAPLRDLQTAEADLAQARADLRTAEAALEAARNRLSILGKTDAEITAFQEQGKISSETPIFAPLSGTVVQRRIGPGQYVSYTSTGAVDPVYTIGDLSSIWVVAYIRESEAPKVAVGQQMDFTVMAYPDVTFHANVNHVAASLDPNIRRLMVRATVDNTKNLFKPEMFASVIIYTEEGDSSPAIPRSAVIYEADKARVWVARNDKAIEVREIKTGITSGDQVQVMQGLQPGEMVVTKGSLFIDQAAGS